MLWYSLFSEKHFTQRIYRGWQDNRSVSTFVIYISGHAVSAAPSKQDTVINKPLPPKPGDNQNTNKKVYIAIYNFTAVEDGDLELQMVNKLLH